MSVGGVVLAGGRSTRMGTSKALLDWHGRPLVVHVTMTLQAALAGAPVAVVRAAGQPLPALPDGCSIVEDEVVGAGPLAGLAAGLTALAAHAHAAVVVATDQPFAGPALVARLTRALRPGDDAVAIRLDGRLQPLGAVYRTGLRDLARSRLGGGDASLTGLLQQVRTHVLEGTTLDAAELRSLDTPEAYAAALRQAPKA